jgi:hypothetical protein
MRDWTVLNWLSLCFNVGVLWKWELNLYSHKRGKFYDFWSKKSTWLDIWTWSHFFIVVRCFVSSLLLEYIFWNALF